MALRSLTLFSCSVLVLLSLLWSPAQGYKSINEVCVRDTANPTNPRNCDASLALVCGNNRLCTCASNLHWQDDLEKCTFAVKGSCTDAFGSPGWPGHGGDGGHHGGNSGSPGCPSHATCDARGSGRCECDPGYEPNEDLTECSGGEGLRSAISVFSLVLCYVVAVKLF